VPTVLINTCSRRRVGVEVFARGEVDDRVADDLARAVVGDVAARLVLQRVIPRFASSASPRSCAARRPCAPRG